MLLQEDRTLYKLDTADIVRFAAIHVDFLHVLSRQTNEKVMKQMVQQMIISSQKQILKHTSTVLNTKHQLVQEQSSSQKKTIKTTLRCTSNKC